MTDNLVQYETDGSIAIITMNRPEKLNAVNHELRSGVSEALIRADDDKSIHVVIANPDLPARLATSASLAEPIRLLSTAPRNAGTPTIHVGLSPEHHFKCGCPLLQRCRCLSCSRQPALTRQRVPDAENQPLTGAYIPECISGRS